jgi:hypothetical protein
MRAGMRRLAWLGLFGCLGLAIAGCYSSDYNRQTAATASMLNDLGAKLADYCRVDFKLGDRDISSEEMGEFYYGLKKARSYAAVEAASNSTRQSYRDLLRLTDDYAQLLSDADRYRLAGKPDPQHLKEILARQQQVGIDAQAVLTGLRQAS